MYASSEFLEKKGFMSGDMVVIEGEASLTLRVELDMTIGGDIPYLPTFDTKLDTKQFFPTGYRFADVSIRGAR